MSNRPESRPTVTRNAADPSQRKFAERLERRRLEDRQRYLLASLATVEGRAVRWGDIGNAGVYRSAFNTHGGVQSYNLGRQDFGHELIAEILALPGGSDLYLQMEQEGRAREAREDAAVEASHTRRAQEEESGS